jgi:3-oxoacyl-[acyl-carrier protein] reductase
MIRPTDITLQGSVAVVTGGGAGIGSAIAATFASFGACVAIVDVDAARAEATAARITGAGGQAQAFPADVTRKDSVNALADRVRAELGPPHILVNNVGDILNQVKPFLETDEDDWDALYRVNLQHVFRCVRSFAPSMVETGRGGSIITISSIEGFRGIPNCTVYATFKASIGGFVRSLALELGPFGVRVNAIAPETTETEQIQPKAITKPEHFHLWEYWNPLGRYGHPDDTAAAALFLASDLSQWVTGTTVHVDGGALAAAGFYRIPGEKKRWTLAPVIKESGMIF